MSFWFDINLKFEFNISKKSGERSFRTDGSFAWKGLASLRERIIDIRLRRVRSRQNKILLAEIEGYFVKKKLYYSSLYDIPAHYDLHCSNIVGMLQDSQRY